MATRIKDLTKTTALNDSDFFAIDNDNGTKCTTLADLTRIITTKTRNFNKKLLFGSVHFGENVKSAGKCTADTNWLSNIASGQVLKVEDEYNWTVIAEPNTTAYYKQGGLRWFFELADNWTNYDELLVLHNRDSLGQPVLYTRLDVKILTMIAEQLQTAYPYDKYNSAYERRRCVNLYNDGCTNWWIDIVASYETKNRLYYNLENSYLHAIYGLKY